MRKAVHENKKQQQIAQAKQQKEQNEQEHKAKKQLHNFEKMSP